MKYIIAVLFLFLLQHHIVLSGTLGIIPVLDKDVIIPNGGIFRLWKGQTFQTNNVCDYVKVFEESPYQKYSGLTYSRIEWKDLEKEKDEYLFDEVISPILQDAYEKRCRTTLGLAVLCGTTSSSQIIKGRYAAIPNYLFYELQKSEHPCRADNRYGESWSPDYDSPLLLDRYSRLLEAFAKWIDEPFRDTKLKRKDLIFAIEMRYFGYWGEGAIRNDFYPKTSLIDRYLDIYVHCFPDILLVAGGQETLHLPSYNQYEKNKLYFQIRLNHVSKLFQLKNQRGNIGFFIDSWQYDSDQYDKNSTRIIFNDRKEIVPLYDYLVEKIYGKRYITGELDFFGKDNQKPYGLIVNQVKNRHVSSITTNTLRASHNNVRLSTLSQDVFERVSNAVSEIGYRIVLTSVQINKGFWGSSIGIRIANIGSSNMFADYYELHFIIKDTNGNVIDDLCSKYDIRNVHFFKQSTVLQPQDGEMIMQKFGKRHGRIFIKIIDKKGIEFPLTLSNLGREDDGSYYLCEI